MTEELRPQLISAAKTFVAAFLLVLGSAVQALDPDTLTTGVVVGILMAAARAAVKVTAEFAWPFLSAAVIQLLDKFRQ